VTWTAAPAARPSTFPFIAGRASRAVDLRRGPGEEIKRMLRAVCSLLVLAGVVAPLQTYGSEMIVSKDGVGQIWLQIVGTIDGGDDVKFKRMLVDAINRGEQIVNVSVYSPGGRAIAAMNIGKYIRTLHLTT